MHICISNKKFLINWQLYYAAEKLKMIIVIQTHD